MDNEYAGVITRFLRKDERLISSEENEMPLVLEAKDSTDLQFLQEFLTSNSAKIIEDIAKYGAVLLRGFDVASEQDFESTVLKIKGFKGISEAFMSEEGRIHAGDLKYVLYTNAVYKTGGTLYLGGFHSENYYSADVPSYICFCCLQPSALGGETGLINMEKIYQHLDEKLKEKLEKNTFFVSKWLVSEVEKRYELSRETIIKLCNHFDLPILGKGNDQFILMYKPNIFEHPLTQKKSLQINLFEITNLNEEMRKCFMDDYQGNTWFWHRFVWKLPAFVLKILEYIYLIFASLFFSPKNAFRNVYSKWKTYKASLSLPSFNDKRVGSCFNDQDVKVLAKLIRNYYSSCLWKQGDILLIDNKKVMHAGMPGSGPRQVRAMICNPLNMNYSFMEPGSINCSDRTSETIGYYMTSGTLDDNRAL
ncbi:TauD/TfdA family dioxygenase [Legionella maioricensis]|uniref:TauD/TfdA family dioxygenase n=1 Tax=Legionella maioricensis TaxID=2896528 RepID=A0A9X2D305_9GAMM|nr:TauD/TfdA family dioxygenase [Legionella maioricensis]MCL9684747.1 TauD/TfdA family dioxygenase [Legionella maioricensis]MCL9687775.1 TauD/TfdA family dioxygenase [Legionella maioricensis]